MAVALIAAYRATGDRRALEKALGIDLVRGEILRHARKDLFAVGLAGEPDPEDWMWSMEDVEKALGPEDAAWWIEATRMKGLGNLPSEVDPLREYFPGEHPGARQVRGRIAADAFARRWRRFRPRFEAVTREAARDP